MPDSYSETTTKSWFERLKDSIKSILLGVVLFIVAFPLLWWNEGRAVQTAKSLEEGAAAVVSVDIDTVDSTHEGALVHATGTATTDEMLDDEKFGVAENAIKLIRQVEMYQWQEEEHTDTKRQTGGSEKTTTTYTYVKDWSDRIVNSSEFEHPDGHTNPSTLPFGSMTLTAKKVTLGAFRLSEGQTNRLNDREPLAMDGQRLQAVPESLRSQLQIRDRYLYRPKSGSVVGTAGEPASTSEEVSPSEPAADSGEQESEEVPEDSEPSDGEESETAQVPEAAAVETAGPAQVGDVRVSFAVVKPMTVSLIAQQSGNSFRPYQTEAGDPLDIIESGNHSAEEMFQSAVAANNRLTWILRLVGFVLMAVGVSMVFGPLAVVADVLPILGDLARSGIFVLAIGISLPLSLLTIAVAWLAYRPLLGIALLLAGIFTAIGIYFLFRKKRPAK